MSPTLRQVTIASAALGLALAAWAPRARGQESGPTRLGVVLLPVPAGEGEPQRQVERALLSEALEHSGDEQAWLLVAHSRWSSPRPESQVLAEFKGLAEKGKKQYRYLKLDKAEATFERAIGLLRQQPVAHCEAAQLAALYLYWARSVLDSGEEIGAQALLGQIQRFDPKASPDPAVMPPNLVAAYDLALDERRGRARGKLLVEAEPVAAPVYVDCQRLASGVVEIDGLAGDELWLVAEAPQGIFAQRFVWTDGPRRRLVIFSGHSQDTVRLAEHQLALGKQPVRLASLRGRASPDLDGVAQVLSARVLLVAEWAGPDAGRPLQLGLYVFGGGLAGDPVSVEADREGHPRSERLAEAVRELAGRMKSPSLLALLSPKPVATPPAPVALVEPGPGASSGEPGGPGNESGPEAAGTPWWQTWWFWTAAGVVVAGAAATGVVLGLDAAGSGPSGKVILSISPP